MHLASPAIEAPVATNVPVLLWPVSLPLPVVLLVVVLEVPDVPELSIPALAPVVDAVEVGLPCLLWPVVLGESQLLLVWHLPSLRISPSVSFLLDLNELVALDSLLCASFDWLWSGLWLGDWSSFTSYEAAVL